MCVCVYACVSTAVSSCPDLTDLSTVHLPHFKLNFMITIKIIIIIITPPSHDIENSRSKEDATEPQVEHSLRLKRKSQKNIFFFFYLQLTALTVGERFSFSWKDSFVLPTRWRLLMLRSQGAVPLAVQVWSPPRGWSCLNRDSCMTQHYKNQLSRATSR